MIFTYRGYFGFDVSYHQDSPQIIGDIDFHKMHDYGASFVIIKAGQGDWRDPEFLTSWHNAKGILPRASYWYYDNRYEPKAQARKYWDIIKIDPEGICWIDLEDRQGGDYWDWKHWHDFIEEFKRVSGLPYERIGIYTAFYYWTESTRFATTAQLAYFSRFPLWEAAYGEKDSDPLHPNYALLMCPPPWLTPEILQCGTPVIGHAAGVESLEIDYDQFNGGDAEFERMFGAILPEPPTEINTMQYTVVWPDGARKRLEPTTVRGWTNEILQFGTVAEVTQDNIPDATYPTNAAMRWVKLIDGKYVASDYPSGGMPEKRMEKVQPEEPPTDDLPATVWIGTTKDNVAEYRKVA
jgi:hypothetical protein